MIVISGVLNAPDGSVLSGVSIKLKAAATSSAVVSQVESSTLTDSGGHYSISAEVGQYDVVISAYGQPDKDIGIINVYADSAPGTLNSFLTALGESDLTPTIVTTVEQMRDDAQAAANNALATQGSVTALAAQAQASADAVTSLGQAYETMALAQAAITAGTIPNGRIFTVISSDPLSAYSLWKNVNGTPTAVLDPSTGAQKTYPSGAAVDAVAADVSNLTETIDDDDNIVNAMGGFIDLTGQLAFYFNQLGQVVLGENNVNVNESLKTLFDNINSNLNSINAILTRILFLSQEDTDALWGVMDNANMSPIYLTTDGYVIINTINVFSEISSMLSRFSNYDALYFSSDAYVQKGGMMSDDGKLLFYFNDNGEFILGDGDLNVTQFIKNGGITNEVINQLTATINKYTEGNLAVSGWGDSLMAGAGSGPQGGIMEQLQVEFPSVPMYKFAVGGQGSMDIATRQGGYVNFLTIDGNLIPASGPVNVTASTQTPITSQGPSIGADKAMLGSLKGIPGKLIATFDANGNRLTLTFTRTTAGDPVVVEPVTPFIIPDTDRDYDITIFQYGRNDVKKDNAKQIVMDALAASIAKLKAQNKKFLINSVLQDTADHIGTPIYSVILDINTTIKMTYPAEYVETRMALIRAYDSNNAQDVIDVSNDVTPSSLRSDTTHLNSAGYRIVMLEDKKALIQRGLLS